MDNNEKYFQQKFKDCSLHLNAQSNDIISLKYREIRDNYFYTELFVHLEKIKNLNVEKIGNTMGGNAYVISYGEQKIVIVEHETGLEILYIAGSIASLIGLVLQIGSMIGNHRSHSHFQEDFRDVEVRYFDKKGKFIEDHKHNYLPYETFLLPQSNNVEIDLLKKRVDSLEKKMDKLIDKQKKK